MRIRAYCKGLLEEAADRLSKSWGTSTFPIPKDMEAPYFRLVGAPALKKYPIQTVSMKPYTMLIIVSIN